MTKKYFKTVLIVILSLVVLFEIGYIVSMNVLNPHITDTDIVEDDGPTPEPLPVVGEVAEVQPTPQQTELPDDAVTKVNKSKVIVIDPGHGKPSSLMSEQEKKKAGWVKNKYGDWGEWRHYKSGSSTTNCEGSGCNGRVTQNGTCWFPIGNTDRNTEPDINLKNALAAKKYLEGMGYEVRITRTSNEENPSMSKRLSYCHPGNDRTKEPDARAFISLHSNASGGSAQGTSYVVAKPPYDQAWITPTYADDSNALGKLCNDYISQMTSLKINGNGEIAWEPELVLLCKSPVPCGYLEIGFFDNSSDLAILESESNKIGEAIAKGVDEFCKTH